MAMARAMRVTEEFLLSPSEVELVEVEFRKELAGKREEATLRATVLWEIERYLEIEDILATSTNTWRQPDGFPFHISSKEDAEIAAKKLRAQWGLGSDPIPNLVEFLEERGIKVVCMSLPDKISGMMCWVKHKSGELLPVIALNQDHDGERQRFSLAHELGHIVLVIPPAFDDKEREGSCNLFAGAFLIPLDILVEKIGRHRRTLPVEEILALKPFFGVSAQALVYRCKETKIINQAMYSEIFGDIVRRGWRKKEPMELPKERSTRFGRMCMRALAEECISESKAAELLSVPLHLVHAKLREAAGVSLQ